MLACLKKAMTSLAAFLKAETLFAEIVQYNQSYDFSSCHIWMLKKMVSNEELKVLNCGVG